MINKRKIETRNIVYIGMFAALLGILSQIAIPMPSGLPITLQTFAVALTGIVLSWKLGVASTFVYILLGAVGVPVFANFSAGFQVLFHYSGGFIWGFLFLTFFCGLAALVKHKGIAIVLMLVGLIICHVLGVNQFSIVMGMGIGEAAVMASLPYLIKDMLSVLLAYVVGIQIRKRLRIASLL